MRRKPMPAEPFPPEMAASLPVLARIRDRQLTSIERAPYRRRGIDVATMQRQATIIRLIIADLDAIIDWQAELAAQSKPIDVEAEREKLRQELDRIIAAEQMYPSVIK